MYGLIEGTGFEVLDPSFKACLIGHARVERLWTGARWSEGPAWFPAGRYLIWSDIPNNRMLRWDETDGSVSTFRQPSMNSNGNTVDGQGRLISCEHGARRVTRTEHDGSITVIADRFEGKRLNSPNDVVAASDGSIWFTDPSYGIMADYEGERAESEIGACHVYRVDASGAITIAADDYVKPNGLAFSELKRLCGLTDGNLSRHLSVLEEAGLVAIDKRFEKNRPLTTCRMTTDGRQRFLEYIALLERIVRQAAETESNEQQEAGDLSLGGAKPA
jgi:gluconolactonase